MFGIGDPNKYFAPSYCYIISPFDTLYRGQSHPYSSPHSQILPSLRARHFVYRLFLTKPRCSLTSTMLLFPTTVSTIRMYVRTYVCTKTLSKGNLFDEKRSSSSKVLRVMHTIRQETSRLRSAGFSEKPSLPDVHF